MRHIVLLWPHANARYREAIEPLAIRELSATLRRAFPEEEPGRFAIQIEQTHGARYLAFDMPVACENAYALLRAHSALYLLLREENGAWTPVYGPEEAVLGEDISGILKYKGKTNERFTRFVLNMAYLSMECTLAKGERLRMIDPLCGKGTSLFEAINRGWEAFGSDIDASDIQEGFLFYKKYLEYHRVKHTTKAFSMTTQRGKGSPVRSISPAGAGEARFAVCDVDDVPAVFGKGQAHIVAADLPYGVQHAPGAKGGAMGEIRTLAARSLKSASVCLKPGGVAAVSFNTNTLPLTVVRALAQEAGLTPLVGGPYDGLAHWVEQAVTRDVCVAVRHI